MALNAKGIPACFLGTAQLSQQVKEDAWRGEKGPVRLAWCALLCFQLFAAAHQSLFQCVIKPPCRAGKYQFVYITPEMASVSLDRLLSLQRAAVRGCWALACCYSIA